MALECKQQREEAMSIKALECKQQQLLLARTSAVSWARVLPMLDLGPEPVPLLALQGRQRCGNACASSRNITSDRVSPSLSVTTAMALASRPNSVGSYVLARTPVIPRVSSHRVALLRVGFLVALKDCGCIWESSWPAVKLMAAHLQSFSSCKQHTPYLWLMTPKPVAPAQLAALAQLVARKLMKLMALVHLAPLRLAPLAPLCFMIVGCIGDASKLLGVETYGKHHNSLE